MLIRKVELENIKNYDAASYEFDAGVTAICGPNGAGKTTILEAIAYALFDSLPYRKEDFLKRGTKKGVVRVTFVSAVDGREYTVNRDTGSSYFVFDPITKARLVEQKGQVSNWIREHLGVDAGTDLRTLFTSSIGVPQGTFTVDFAEQPAKRKIGFDKVLRVEEYQEASDGLRVTLRHIEGEDARLQSEIARLEGELQGLDEQLAERARKEAELARLTTEIAAAEKQQAELRLEVERLDLLKSRIEQLTNDTAAWQSQVDGLERQQSLLQLEVQRAEQAKTAMAAAKEGYERHKEAVEKLAELEPQTARRDALKRQREELQHQKIRLEMALQALQQRQQQIDADRLQLENLRPQVSQQQELEEARQQVQRAIAELSVFEKNSARDQKALQDLRQEYAVVTRRVEEAEEVRELAERLPSLEAERQTLVEKLHEAQLSFQHLSLKQKEAKRSTAALAKLAGEIKTLEGELAAVGEPEQLAKDLPGLEAQAQRLVEQYTALRLSIEREEQIIAEVRDGKCPLLSERCLNMKEGQGLDQFFQLQVRNERQQLKEVERQRKELDQRVGKAREALQLASVVVSQRTQLARYRQDYEVMERDLARMQRELGAIKVDEAEIRRLQESATRLDEEVKQAQAARAKFEGAAVLKERLEVLKVEGKEKRAAYETLQEKIEELSQQKARMPGIEAELERLGDPRSRSKALAINIATEPEVRAAIAKASDEAQQLDGKVEELEDALRLFAELDGEIARWREARAAFARDYELYIENQPLAQTLAARREELEALGEQLTGIRESLAATAEELQAAQAQYEAARHEAARQSLGQLLHQLGFLAAERSNTESRLAQLQQEIARLLEIKAKREALEGEHDRWEKLHTTSDFVRDLLKRAGPFITEAHLQAVSLEANQLYREVTGNPMVSLKWEAGYEVILEEDGHERPFISLSGGEQMAAALAVRLALLKELSEIRLAFFDEPTTNMDEERRRNLAQQIGRIKDFNQLFVISHDDAFEGFTDRVVTVGNAAER